MINKKNIFDSLSIVLHEELFENIISTENFRLEKIISAGQTTPEGVWYDQKDDEWVILLKGKAMLAFEGESELLEMKPGDYIHIPAHLKHRVEYTDTENPTVWLALHYKNKI